MPTQKRATREVVRLFPVPGAFIHGEPAIERVVTEQEAERLLSFSPPAFTRTPPTQPVAIQADVDAEPQE